MAHWISLKSNGLLINRAIALKGRLKMSEIVKIQNSRGLDIHLYIDMPINGARDDGQRGEGVSPIIFHQHGFCGSVTSAHDQIFRRSYRERGFIVIGVESSNSLNAAGGDLSGFMPGHHVQDLREAVDWLRADGRFGNVDKFYLSGHSMGGFSVLANAAHFGDSVRHVLSSAPVVSGDLILSQKPDPGEYWDSEKWQADSVHHFALQRGGVAYKGELSYDSLNLWRDYNVFDFIDQISAPVHLLAAEHDSGIPPCHIRKIYDHLCANNYAAKLTIIPDATHIYAENLDALRHFLRSDFLPQ